VGKAEAELETLRAALAQLAADDALEVLAEARAEARARVRAALTDVLSESLTESIKRQLGPAGHPSEVEYAQAPRRVESAYPVESPHTVENAHSAQTPRQADPPVPPHDPPILGAYVYGVVWATDASFTEELSGLDPDGPVTTLIEGPLAAVVSRVPLAEFEEDELRSHLSDLEWVERVARAHEAVLDDLCARTVVIPMRMCTVYRSDENLRAMLRREELNLRSALEFLDGKLEWGVKVIAQQASNRRAPDAAAAADDARAAESGADYMARRRARRDEQAEVEGQQADAAAEIHEALGALAHDGQLNPVQNGDLPGETGQLVMNGVYLVERENTDAFHQEVDDLRERFADIGLDLVPSGPWPPYNFVPGDVGATW
jgi:hypothetical protein